MTQVRNGIANERTIKSLSHLCRVVKAAREKGYEIYIRYSLGPDVDAKRGYSIDHTTGMPHDGLSAENLFDGDQLWEDGNREYVAMQVRSYCYMMLQGIEGTRAWICTGNEVGRDSDNAPTIENVVALAWVDESVIHEAQEADRLF